MKHKHPVPSFVLRLTGGLPTFFAAISFASSSVSAATYQQNIFPITDTDQLSIINKTSTGYTEVVGAPATGAIQYVGNGLSFNYELVGGWERLIIGNVDDITGAGIQLDRYISFTLGPGNIDALAGYAGDYTVDLTEIGRSGLHIETGGHFEIRTSVDNFAGPLAVYDPSSDRLNPTAPGLTSNLSAIQTNDTVVTTDTPLEVRFYVWYDLAGVNGSLGTGTNDMRFRYEVTTIPEPAAAVLMGATALVTLLRRRRAGKPCRDLDSL